MTYPFLDPIRSAIPPETRQRWYDISTAIVGALAMWGLLGTSEVPAWTSLVVGVVTLMFAVLYSESTVRVSFYTVLLAVQGVAGLYGILDNQKWAAILSVASALLGTAVAGSNTPTHRVIDPEGNVLR